MGRRVKWILLGILFLGALLRCRGIFNPLLDNQGWRQADTASMALNMLGHLGNFPDVFFPMLNYDGVGPQKVELEFPFLPYLLALTWSIFGWADLWGRVWAILFSLTTIWGVFDFGRRAFSLRTGIATAVFYAMIPLTAYYGRVVMPEPISQAFSIWALNVLLIYRDHPSKKSFFGAALLLSAAVLAKLPQLMIFPVALILGFWPLRGKGLKMLQFSIVALFLPMLYYLWVHYGAADASQFVSGILSEQLVKGPTMFVEFLKTFLREGIGMPVLILAGIGLTSLIASGKSQAIFDPSQVKSDKGNRLGVITWSMISLLYVFIICLRIPLDYYLVPIVLPVVICAGIALNLVEDIPAKVIGVLVISLLLMNYTFDYAPKYQWDERYLIQANWLHEHTEKKDVLFLSDSQPMTLYYAHRYGYRLNKGEDSEALKQLQQFQKDFKGDYFIALPTSRGTDFWEQVGRMYPEVGPGVYRLRED